jgi:hypothetical protein
MAHCIVLAIYFLFFPNPGSVAPLEFLALNHREIKNPQGQRETKL